MGIAPGLLIQPFCSVKWGDMNLTAYPGLTGELERIAQGVSLSYTKGEEAPSADFEIVPNVDGFEVAALIRNSPKLLTEIVEIKMGYGHMEEPILEGYYIFAGLDFTTGQDPALKFTVTSAVKSSWTDNKMNFTMEEEIPLSEFPAFLQEKAGKGANLLKFKFVGQAAEDAPDIMVKANHVNQSAQTILAETLKEHGMELRTMDTSIDGTMVIGYNAGKEGELEKDKPELDGKPEPAVRRIHILGPGLLENAKRSQSFSLGQSDTEGGAKNKATATSETENKNSKNPKALPEKSAGESKTQVGTTGPSDKPQARSGTTKSKPDSKEDARSALADSLKMTLSASFPMLPQVVGMKPGDILAIPSVRGPGEWIEDYEITSVNYKQSDTGEVMMDIQGEKPYIGKKNILSEDSVMDVQARVSQLTTPDAWNQYYWRMGPSLAWPLAGASG